MDLFDIVEEADRADEIEDVRCCEGKDRISVQCVGLESYRSVYVTYFFSYILGSRGSSPSCINEVTQRGATCSTEEIQSTVHGTMD
jgi:hypothetical protein